jgi:hypothetical protein
MRNVSDKNCRESQNRHFVLSILFFFFRKSCSVWRNVDKYGRVGEATDDGIIRRMRFTCWITKATDTYAEYIMFISFPRHKSYVIRTSAVLLFTPGVVGLLSCLHLLMLHKKIHVFAHGSKLPGFAKGCLLLGSKAWVYTSLRAQCVMETPICVHVWIYLRTAGSLLWEIIDRCPHKMCFEWLKIILCSTVLHKKLIIA